ncbi:MAG: NCS2 family permease [Candidatus Ancillula sp.]|jgi:AGZA family xanthine/uracil permease-like MFS transporter|nr:NCS2 family permease [Candidatus Ancillula sp.]
MKTGVIAKRVDRYFKITERGSKFSTEIRGGVVTFLAMCYIIALNGVILGGPDSTGATLPAEKIAAATAICAGFCSILMGVVGKVPISMAAGLGVSPVVAAGAATLKGATWADIMGLVVIEGLIILILVLTGLRKAVFNTIPKDMRNAIGIGIGLFICLIGLVDSGFIQTGKGTILTLSSTGKIHTIPLIVFIVSLLLIIIFSARKIKGGFLIAIIISTILAVILEGILHLGSKVNNPDGWVSSVPTWEGKAFSLPDFSLIGHFNILGSFQHIGIVTALLFIFSLMMTDFFDTMGTIVALSNEANLNDKNGEPENIQRIFVADAISASLGGVCSVSSNTVYAESASGIGDGAKTGIASITTGILFIIASFFSSLVAIIPSEAVTPALVFVGFLMLAQIVKIDFSKFDTAIPASIIIIMIPFTYSITDGIGFGFVTYVLIKVFTGKFKEVSPLMYGLVIVFFIYFII